MDKLTLIALANTEPRTVVQDSDRDFWHAACLLHWMEVRPRSSVLNHLLSACAEATHVPANKRCFNHACPYDKELG